MHDFVQPTIFEDIAKEAIDTCRLSIGSARTLMLQSSQEISKETDGNEALAEKDGTLLLGSIDADLFLIRHLLVLKRMVNDLRLGADKDGDQGGIGIGLASGRGTLGLGM
jgi:hypothetical protein